MRFCWRKVSKLKGVASLSRVPVSQEAANCYNKMLEEPRSNFWRMRNPRSLPKSTSRVENWFAKGLTPEINRLLAEKLLAERK